GVDANDPSLVLNPPIEGMPAWVNSERYTINAKSAGQTTPGMMQGPMLQALLEDRFKLKMHREARDIAVYALTIEKGGFKLKPVSESSCADSDDPPPPGTKQCVRRTHREGGNSVIDAENITIDEFRKFYLNSSPAAGLDRPVIDQTGL